MDNGYIIVRALQQHLIALCNFPFNIPSHLVDLIEGASTKKWNWIVFYYAIALLNPQSIQDVESWQLRCDGRIHEGVRKNLSHWSRISHNQVWILLKLSHVTIKVLGSCMESSIWRKFITCTNLQATMLKSCSFTLYKGFEGVCKQWSTFLRKCIFMLFSAF